MKYLVLSLLFFAASCQEQSEPVEEEQLDGLYWVSVQTKVPNEVEGPKTKVTISFITTEKVNCVPELSQIHPNYPVVKRVWENEVPDNPNVFWTTDEPTALLEREEGIKQAKAIENSITLPASLDLYPDMAEREFPVLYAKLQAKNAR
jgi:hypothetical protein